MVLGNGLVGKRFHSYSEEDQFLIFASGVSNSKTTNQEVYDREIKLLRQTVREHIDRSIVYFSTCSIYDPDEKNSEYVRHKQNIEEFIQTNARQYNIFRVYIEINKGNCFEIDISLMKPVADDLKIKFTPDYLPALLRKYF